VELALPLDQPDEHILRGVERIVFVAQELPASADDHRSVPTTQ
jgi:hypothetical protein